MDVSKIKAGNNIPSDLNVVIEISSHSNPVKYEIDKESGALIVDRIQHNSMFYPCNYGFVPNTLADDNDPLDVLVVSQYSLLPGSVINTRPVGVLKMEDEGGMDAKIICVPSSKVCPIYSNVKDVSDLDKSLLQEIEFFFSHYKDTQESKWTKVYGMGNLEEALEIIKKSIK